MQIKHLWSVLWVDSLKILILETFILALMGSGIKSYGENLISWKILIKTVIAQVIMIVVLINMMLNVEYR